MKPDLQYHLVERYPLILRRLRKNECLQPQYSIDACGIECGDGWFGVVDHFRAFWERHLVSLIVQGCATGLFSHD